MYYRDICRVLAFFLFGLSAMLLFPLGVSIYYEWFLPKSLHPQLPCAGAFIFTLIISLAVSSLLYVIGKRSQGQLFRREALLLVVMVYFMTAVIGSLPFLFNGTLKNPVDAFFESVSGLTTTGATILEAKNYDSATQKEIPIAKSFSAELTTAYSFFGTVSPVRDSLHQQDLTGIEAVGKGLLFWRSFMQWLGGGGIIVLFVAILPALGVGGKILYQTEMTGPTKDSLAPQIKEAASQLWKIYLGLTLLEIILLVSTNHRMPFFDAITIALSTISTGGFSVRNASIGAYNNVNTEWIVMLFMLLGSISFSLYFYCMRGKFSRLNDPELKLFLCIVFGSCLFAAWQLFKTSKILLAGQTGTFSFLESLRYGSFQVISSQTSTGFVTADYDLWPFPLQTWIFILMFIGGMAGSTAGGLKVIRQQSMFKIIFTKIESIFRPDSVRLTRIGNSPIEPKLATTILTFILTAISLSIIGTFALILDGIDPETSLTTIGCMVNNSGFAFRMAGPEDSFAFLSNFGKILSAFLMIAGRLEYFAILTLLTPAFWRRT